MKLISSAQIWVVAFVYTLLANILIGTLGLDLFTDKGEFLNTIWFIRFHYLIGASLCIAFPMAFIFGIAFFQLMNNVEIATSIDEANIAKEKYEHAAAKMEELIRELSLKK